MGLTIEYNTLIMCHLRIYAFFLKMPLDCRIQDDIFTCFFFCWTKRTEAKEIVGNDDKKSLGSDPSIFKQE